MRIRALIAAAVGLPLVLVGAPAHARYLAPPCDLVRDPAGDAQIVPGVADPSDTGTGALDIVSADVASNTRTLGVAIRVVNLRAVASVQQQRGYDFFFDSAGQTFDFKAQLPPNGAQLFEVFVGPRRVSPTGDDSYSSYSGNGIAQARGVVDLRRNEIRIFAKLKTIRAAAKVTSPLTRFLVETWRDSPTPLVQGGYREDLATGDPQYHDEYQLGRRSCLDLTT